MTVNRFRDENPLKTGHGKLYEGKAAGKLSARPTPASGAMQGAKGDLRAKKFLYESKTTLSTTMHLELGWLNKITSEANAVGLCPALVFSYVRPDGTPLVNASSEWVAVPMYLWKELTGQ